MIDPDLPIAGAVLIGGKSRRMGGGDKCLQLLGGKSLLSRIVERFSPQVSKLLLNANGNTDRFAEFGLPVLPDCVGDFAGPLAGILTAMRWAADTDCRWVMTAAGDAPFLPSDLVARCVETLDSEDAQIVCAASNGRTHPVCGLWNVSLADDLEKTLVDEDVRKIDVWTSRYKLVVEEFSATPIDPFFNVNSPADLAEAETLLAEFAKDS